MCLQPNLSLCCQYTQAWVHENFGDDNPTKQEGDVQVEGLWSEALEWHQSGSSGLKHLKMPVRNLYDIGKVQARVRKFEGMHAQASAHGIK